MQVNATIGGATLTGTYGLEINTAVSPLLSLPAGPFFQFKGDAQTLTLPGAALSNASWTPPPRAVTTTP